MAAIRSPPGARSMPGMGHEDHFRRRSEGPLSVQSADLRRSARQGRGRAETRRCRGGYPTAQFDPQKPFSLAYRAGPPPLVPTVALYKNSAGVGTAASPSPKLSRNAKKPIQSGSGARVEPRRRRRAVFARGDGLVQQCPNFLAGDVARPPGLAQSVAHFVCRCSKEFRFKGVKQRR